MWRMPGDTVKIYLRVPTVPDSPLPSMPLQWLVLVHGLAVFLALHRGANIDPTHLKEVFKFFAGCSSNM